MGNKNNDNSELSCTFIDRLRRYCDYGKVDIYLRASRLTD